jgi:hypothetical protein
MGISKLVGAALCADGSRLPVYEALRGLLCLSFAALHV